MGDSDDHSAAGGSDDQHQLGAGGERSTIVMTDAMSVSTLATGRAALAARRERWQLRWTTASQQTRTRIQVAVLLGTVLVAYNYSLSTLLQTADQQTPLAYISLVPAIALALAAIRSKPLRPEPPIYDRHVDYTIGIPLIVAAIAVNELLPARMSTMFWVYRVDLLTLPVFVAGAVAIIFGTRVLWRQRLAVAFLFLAWPYPYQKYLLGVLNAFTALTLLAMQKIAVVTHLAKPAGSLDNTLFVITHHGSTFALSVVSACSGVNGVVGFLLVGSAFAAIVRGPLVRKVLWLMGGMALLWAINLIRITFIFYAGKEWGESVAINVFHPFIGLVTFSLGVLAMILLIKPLGMHIAIGESAPAAPPAPAGPIPVPSLYDPAEGASRPKLNLAVPRITMAVVVAVVAALVIGLSNLGLRSYNLVADVGGQAKLAAFIQSPTAPPGWNVQYDTTYGWAKPLFGDTSVWNRYYLHASGPGPLQTNVPVVADVINTPDLSSFSAYGVENCYTFHGYALADVAQVSLVGGVTGQAMSYTSQQYGSWSIVYWILPVKLGAGTSYERTVLYVQNAGQGAVVRGLTTGDSIHNLAGSLDPGDRSDRALINNRTFLVAFAKQLIEKESARTAHDGSSTTAVSS
jgi:exosortase/archaeosortase family protein